MIQHLQTVRRFLLTEQERLIIQKMRIKRKRLDRKLDAANEAFADFEPLGNGISARDYFRGL